MVEETKEALPMDVHILANWAQRAVCLISNTNCTIAAECRRSIVVKIDLKLRELAYSEATAAAKGLLFREAFVKDMSRFVNTFAALDKGQTLLKKSVCALCICQGGRSRGVSASH